MFVVVKPAKCLAYLLVWAFISASARAGTLAQIQTGLGEIDIELFDQDKPITVNNFIQLAQAGAFVNSFFHRCEPGFVVQGGGYFAFNPFLTNIIAPPYANLGLVGNFGNVPNEYGVGQRFSNVFGTIAMAKVAGDTNSANSQFFINLNNNTQLDATNSNDLFVVFGHVVRGTNILNAFNSISKGNNLVNLQDTYGTNGLFPSLPTYQLGTNPPPYSQLVYFSVSILSAQVAINRTNGARQISWTSINGVTNNVEFATNFPPVWQVLTSTNGNGALVTYTDSATNNARRFYRIHVLY